MANRFVRRARDGGDRNEWADFQHAQDYLGIPVNTPLIYLDGADLKYSKGIVGIDDGSDIGSCIFDTILILSTALLTNSLWAKVEVYRTNTSINVLLTSIAGANDPSALPAALTSNYDAEKGGYYIQADRRLVGLVWINAAGAVEGIVNCLNGANYAGYSTSDDANDIPYYFSYQKQNITVNTNKVRYFTESANFTALGIYDREVYEITTVAASFDADLPAAASWANKRIKLIKVDTGAGICTADPNGAETLGPTGATAFPMRNQGDYIELESDGTNIYVIDSLATLDSAALAANQVQTLAHGCGVMPRKREPVLLCGTADISYSANDEVSKGVDSAGVNRQWTCTYDATNIKTLVDLSGIYIQRKDTGLLALPTIANWKIRIRYSL